jgi:hypothetical protein
VKETLGSAHQNHQAILNRIHRAVHDEAAVCQQLIDKAEELQKKRQQEKDSRATSPQVRMELNQYHYAQQERLQMSLMTNDPFLSLLDLRI